MDKETLSNYGWVVIAVLVLSVMIALATPFGKYIATAVENTTQGLFDVQQNALGAAGMVISDQSFDSSQINNCTLKFGRMYSFADDNNVRCIFFEDGSAMLSSINGGTEGFPKGSFVYDGRNLFLAEGNSLFGVVSEDGTSITSEDEVVMLLCMPIWYGKEYRGVDDEGNTYIQIFYEDGSFELTTYRATDGQPMTTSAGAGALTYNSETLEVTMSLMVDDTIHTLLIGTASLDGESFTFTDKGITCYLVH